MSAKKSGSIGIGIAFVIAGLMLLAYRFGYIGFNVFWAMVDLWPLWLVAIGVSIIFKDKQWIKGVTWIILIAVIVVYGYYGQGSFRIFGMKYIDYELTLGETTVALQEEAETGRVKLNLGAGQIDIGSTDDVTIYTSYPEEVTRVDSEFSSDGQRFEMDIRHDDDYLPKPRVGPVGLEYVLDLNEDMIWSLDVDMGAMDMDMDLRDLIVDVVDLDLGAGDLELYLGAPQDKSTIKVDSGVSDVTVYVPKEVPVRLKFDGGIKDLDLVGQSTFRKDGDDYVTSGADFSGDYFLLDVSTGVGELTIEQY